METLSFTASAIPFRPRRHTYIFEVELHDGTYARTVEATNLGEAERLAAELWRGPVYLGVLQQVIRAPALPDPAP